MKVRIVNKSKSEIKQQHIGDAGFDLTANIENPITLLPLQRELIPTGIYLDLPANSEAQVRPRSGLAIKYGITVLNSPGTIDVTYKSEIKCIMINMSNQVFAIEPNMRIAQLVFQQIPTVEIELITDIEEGRGGFGSTGLF
jgi:dUTP pyrophosphatase